MDTLQFDWAILLLDCLKIEDFSPRAAHCLGARTIHADYGVTHLSLSSVASCGYILSAITVVG